jgi:hypothetical protein
VTEHVRVSSCGCSPPWICPSSSWWPASPWICVTSTSPRTRTTLSWWPTSSSPRIHATPSSSWWWVTPLPPSNRAPNRVGAGARPSCDYRRRRQRLGPSGAGRDPDAGHPLPSLSPPVTADGRLRPVPTTGNPF